MFDENPTAWGDRVSWNSLVGASKEILTPPRSFPQYCTKIANLIWRGSEPLVLKAFLMTDVSLCLDGAL